MEYDWLRRPALQSDLKRCTGLVPDWIALDAGERRALPRLWSRLLGQPAFHAEILVRPTATGQPQLAGLGMAIVLNRQWEARMRQSPPATTVQLYRALAEGSFVPPPAHEIAMRNAAGCLELFVLHTGCLPDLPADQAQADLLCGLTAGLQVQQLYREVARPGGPVLHSSFTPPRFEPPCLHLGAADQRSLRLAVAGLSDAQIAEELGITERSVRRAWQVAAQRTCARLPALCALRLCEIAPGELRPEVRTMLLDYLRTHPEELRPYPAPELTVNLQRAP